MSTQHSSHYRLDVGCCFGTCQDWGVKDITLQPILCEKTNRVSNSAAAHLWKWFNIYTLVTILCNNLTKLRWLDYDTVISSKWRILSKLVDSWILRGSQLFQKKGMHSEAWGNKWIEQIICQCTLDQIHWSHWSGSYTNKSSLNQDNQLITLLSFKNAIELDNQQNNLTL